MSLRFTSSRRYIATTVWLLIQRRQDYVKLANAFTVTIGGVGSISSSSGLRWMSSSSSLSSSSSSRSDDDDDYFGKRMQAWSLEDDWFLYRHYQEDSPEYVAKELGRGIRGVEARWSKLNSVSSPAYRRLFTPKHPQSSSLEEEEEKEKLVPVQEVLQRIQWDPALESKDFVVWYKDRYQMDGKLMTSPFLAPNESVKGKELLFVKAIPPHRIQAIQYKTDYIIWDKDARLYHETDLNQVASEEHYAQWKKKRLIVQKQLSQHLQQCLGNDKFQTLKESSSQLLQTYKSTTIPHHPETIDKHVQFVLRSFQSIYQPSSPTLNDANQDEDNNNNNIDNNISPNNESTTLMNENPSQEEEEEEEEEEEVQILEESSQFVQPTSDVQSLQLYLDMVSFLPHYDLRTKLTRLVQNKIVALQQAASTTTTKNNNNSTSNGKNQSLMPRLNEEDLEEKFVRGSGNGGQKVNKTSNRVILLHIPTQLRVECQDTRSLQQNRKIARKRLQQKLDHLWNGSMSKKAKAQQKIRKKKQKSRSKANKKLDLATKQEKNNKIQPK